MSVGKRLFGCLLIFSGMSWFGQATLHAADSRRGPSLTPAPYPTVILTSYQDEPSAVIGVADEKAQIEYHGKVVALGGDARFVPTLAKFYAPGRIQIAEERANSRRSITKSLEGVQLGPAIYDGSEYSARITPASSYSDCYVAVVFFDERILFGAIERPTAGVFFHQIGDLEAGKEQSVHVDLGKHIPAGRFAFFALYFTHGMEIRSNLDRLPYAYFRMVDLARHRQILASYRTKNAQNDLQAQPYLMVPPILPAEVDAATLPVSVVVTFHVSADGTAEDGIEFKASLPPPVGNALAAAMANWLFLPSLKKGIPIDATVQIPIQLHK